jgi:hypothetical protein
VITRVELDARDALTRKDDAPLSVHRHVERPPLFVAGQRDPTFRVDVPRLLEGAALLFERELEARRPGAALP